MSSRIGAALICLALASCQGYFSVSGDAGDSGEAPPRPDTAEPVDMPEDSRPIDAPPDEAAPEDVPVEAPTDETGSEESPEDLVEDESPCTPVPAPPATAGELFARAGVFVVSPTATFPPSAFGGTLRDNHFSWVALQIIDGTIALDEGGWTDWIAGWRCYLPYVGAWGVNRTSPAEEADLTADKVADYGFAFYIADAELEYKYSQDSGYCPECFERTQRWITGFQARLAGRGITDLPSAVTSYGRVDLADLDWRAWSNTGFHFLPQAYWNEYDIYEPLLCVQLAVTWIRPEVETSPFWTAGQVHPLIGLWGGGASGYVTARQYLDDLSASRAAWGQTGFSVYRGDMCPAEEWPVLGEGILGGLAAY